MKSVSFSVSLLQTNTNTPSKHALTRATGQLARVATLLELLAVRIQFVSPYALRKCGLLLTSHPKFTSPAARSSRPRAGTDGHHPPSPLRQDRAPRPAHRRARAPLPPKQVRLELLAKSLLLSCSWSAPLPAPEMQIRPDPDRFLLLWAIMRPSPYRFGGRAGVVLLPVYSPQKKE
jgi:hypothetical protein